MSSGRHWHVYRLQAGLLIHPSILNQLTVDVQPHSIVGLVENRYVPAVKFTARVQRTEYQTPGTLQAALGLPWYPS